MDNLAGVASAKDSPLLKFTEGTVYRRIPLASPRLKHAHFGDLVGLYTGRLLNRHKIMVVTIFLTCEEK